MPATYTHATTEVLRNPLLSNGSVNMPLQQQLLLETVFSTRSVQSGYKEQY
jgi:hypothetical protein